MNGMKISSWSIFRSPLLLVYRLEDNIRVDELDVTVSSYRRFNRLTLSKLLALSLAPSIYCIWFIGGWCKELPPMDANSERDFTKSFVNATLVYSFSNTWIRALDTWIDFSLRIFFNSCILYSIFTSMNFRTPSKLFKIILNAAIDNTTSSPPQESSQIKLNERLHFVITSSSPTTSSTEKSRVYNDPSINICSGQGSHALSSYSDVLALLERSKLQGAALQWYLPSFLSLVKLPLLQVLEVFEVLSGGLINKGELYCPSSLNE